jgi:peptide/nickel transport system substrate-binding protein
MSIGQRGIGRRAVLKRSLLAAASALPRPPIAQAASRVLRFVPVSGLTAIDPIYALTIPTLTHAYMVYDQLFGLDASLTPQPQMVAGYELSDDRLHWRFTLREGLLFHDGTPVRAADCVASIRRWAKRDLFGVRLAARLDEMRALDDRSFEIRLKRPFVHMLYAFGATTCFIVPERVAQTDAFTAFTDPTGSGPFRFVQDEYLSGSRVVYARHDGYVPRQEKPEAWSGGKMANFDRVEWQVITEAATAMAALQTGEIDWVERPLLDLLPTLRRVAGVTTEALDPIGLYAILWFNNAAPPFDNPKLRRALLPAINQLDFMQAIVGDQPDLMRTGVGMFPAGSPYASDAGIDVVRQPRDLALARRLIAESGYKGERIVQIAASEQAESDAMAQVAFALLKSLGLNVEYQRIDSGTLLARTRSKDPAVRAGWSFYCVAWAGLWPANPGTSIPLSGYVHNPRMDTLLDDWFDAPDLPAQKQVADRMQVLGFEEPPFLPIGQYFPPQAHRTTLTGFVHAPLTAFWNVRRS